MSSSKVIFLIKSYFTVALVSLQIISGTFVLAQDRDSARYQSFSFNVLPILFYSPETQLAFGAAGLLTHRPENQADTLYPSTLFFGASYTTFNQILTYFSPRIYLDQNRLLILGEAGYYQYFYYFYGIGQDVVPEERFDVNFPRIRLSLLRHLCGPWYLGLSYWFEDYNIQQYYGEERLRTRDIAGNQGGISSSLGLHAFFDSRDNIFFPSDGRFFQWRLNGFHGWLGSDFEFVRHTAEYSWYYSVFDQDVWAFNLYLLNTWGTVPFQLMGLMGEENRMRGIYAGQVRDRQMLNFQSEYRMTLGEKWAITALTGLGAVAPELFAWDRGRFVPTFGVGGRFLLDSQERVYIRLDLAFSPFGFNPYFNLGEAF